MVWRTSRLSSALLLLRAMSTFESDGLHFPQHLMSGGHLPRPKPADRVKPGPGQQSVWEYPFTRPPTLQSSSRHAIVHVGQEGPELVNSKRAVLVRGIRRDRGCDRAQDRRLVLTPLQVCEESHPPTWYFPRDDVNMSLLAALGGSTACEFKGQARYFNVLAAPGGAVAARQAAWSYEGASGANEAIRGYIAVYLRDPLVATVDGEVVRPQEGDYYGGWITRCCVRQLRHHAWPALTTGHRASPPCSNVVGPFKGGPGTRFW